jgi:hypothetical protein
MELLLIIVVVLLVFGSMIIDSSIIRQFGAAKNISGDIADQTEAPPFLTGPILAQHKKGHRRLRSVMVGAGSNSILTPASRALNMSADISA